MVSYVHRPPPGDPASLPLWVDTELRSIQQALASIVGVVRSGVVAPTASIGADGDWYIDTVANRMYGPKANGAWPTSFYTL